MKSHLLIAIGLLALVPFAGCKKKSFDPASKSLQDFVGTWEGTITTFKENKLMQESGAVVIFPDAGGATLSGVFLMKENRIFHEFQFVQGTLYFNVENNDPDNAFCQNWSLGGFAVFSEEGKIDIRITGNECGDIGGEFVNWTGTLVNRQIPADSVKYFNFGGSGHSWAYDLVLNNGSTCTMSKVVNTTGTYSYLGTIAHTCSWANPPLILKWNVTPAVFSILLDSTLCDKPLSIPVSAKPGVTYRTLLSPDTLTLSMVDTLQTLTTPAGTFVCSKYLFTEPVYRDSVKHTRATFLWLDNRFGIVRMEVTNPVGPEDIGFMELSDINF